MADADSVADGVPARAPRGSARRALLAWALAVFILLPLSSVAGLAASYWSIDRALEHSPVGLLDLLLVTVAVAWTGSSGAALRSAIDRFGNGFEFDSEDGRRAQWPPRPEKTARFSTLMAPGLLARPFLGALIGPIAYLVLRAGAEVVTGGQQVDDTMRDVVAAAAIAGLVGMFAKSIWEALNKRATALFK